MAKTPKFQDEYQKARKGILITKELFSRLDKIRQVKNINKEKKDGSYISRDSFVEQIIEKYVAAKEKEYEKMLVIMNKAEKQIQSMLEKTGEQDEK